LLAQYKAENEALKAKLLNKTKIGFKVSEKGALSVYGLQKFPVTLYAEQWVRLLGQSAEIVAFIKANGDKLTTKAS